MRTTKQLFDLTGKTALVTGGSRGLGLQIAQALGEQGAKVVVSSRKQSDLDEAVCCRGSKVPAAAAWDPSCGSHCGSRRFALSRETFPHRAGPLRR